MQRVRIGVTGLAAVFLLVLLAAAVIGTLHRGTPATQTNAAGSGHAAADQPKEPLAELGVAPGNAPPADANAAAPAPAPTDPNVAAAPAPAARPR